MRILFLVDGYYPVVGGAELQATLLAKTLTKRGHTVHIVCPHLMPELPLEEVIDGIPLRRIGYFHVPKLSNVFFIVSFAWFMFKHGREYDAYHIHMVHKMASVIACMRKWLGKPALAKVSGATEFEDGVLDFRKNSFFHRSVRKLLLRLDYFQSLSSYSRKQILAAGAAEDQVITLANGLEIGRFPLSNALHSDQNDEGPTVFAYCGRFEPVKALPMVFRAFARLRAEGFENFSFQFAGHGQLQQELIDLAEELDLGGHVKFCGRISDVPSFLSRAHAYVQVSRYEGLSNSVIEAMCSGLAPVLTRISGNEDLVVHGESGYLVEVDDEDALVSHMKSLLESRERCRSFGLAARQRVETLCALDRVVDTLESIYNQEYRSTPGETSFRQMKHHRCQ